MFKKLRNKIRIFVLAFGVWMMGNDWEKSKRYAESIVEGFRIPKKPGK